MKASHLGLLVILVIAFAACSNGAVESDGEAEPSPGATVTQTPSREESFMFPPGVTPTFIPGLPIDTPPAQESWFYDSPPPGEEVQWEAVKAWARGTCPGPASAEPGLMFHTTGGELRRRIYELTGNRDYLLGSTWKNEDEMWVVVFTGEFDFHKVPPPFSGETAAPISPGTRCLYMGNGRTDAEDRASVGAWTPPNDEPVTFESVFN